MLGGSGCAVSSLCLGTMTFGAETDEAVAHQQLDRFIEAGGTLVDTADVYGGGRSEEIIGRWFASRPADVTGPVVLATKGRMPVDASPNGAGLSARHLARALDASLRRLGLETVDLYQVHAYDPLTPLEETLRTIDQFIQAGKIRYWGLSNFTGWQLTKAVHLARALNVAEPVTLQPQYSLLAREIEWEIVPAATDAGLGLLPWSPLGGGWLSGKYRRDQRPTGATRLGEDPSRGEQVLVLRPGERLGLPFAAPVVVHAVDQPGAVAGPVACQPGDGDRSGAAAAHPDDGGDPAPSPGPGARRPQRLAGLVLEDDPGAEGPPRFFYPRPGLLPPHPDRPVVPLDGAAGAQLATPPAAAQQVPGSRDRVPDPELRGDQVADPGQGPPLVLPARSRRPGIQHPVQLRQLIRTQPAPGRLPFRRQPGRAAGVPGPPPPLHRPLGHPQLSGNVRHRSPLLELLHDRQPDQFPPPAALGGQPAALRIPHIPCLPPETAPVSPTDIGN